MLRDSRAATKTFSWPLHIPLMHSSILSQNTIGGSYGPLALQSQRSAVHAEIIKGVLLSVAYFGMARLGLKTRFDGPMFAVGASLIFPQWRPCILLMVLSVQDAPGQVVPYDYLGVAGISGLMLLKAALQRTSDNVSPQVRQFRGLLRFALVIVVYAVFNSAVQHRFGFHEQSATRPYPVIGGLMAMMMVTGYLAYRELAADPMSAVRVKTVSVCILGHIFFIIACQVLFGPLFGSSPQGAEEMKQLFQMMDGGSRGLARLTGPFLSPNLLASVPGLFMLIILRYQKSDSISIRFIMAFFVVGMAAAVAGGARTMFVFYIAGTAAMTWTRSPKHTLIVGMMAIPLVFLVDIPWGDILQMMRLKDLQSLGVRGELWQASLHLMDWKDWTFGFGLTHFPVFCRSNLGYYGSDPHNWILSASQMFGVLGLLFYVVLIRVLLKKSFSVSRKERAIAITLLLFFVGREFANTQYVLNNHPLCCLYWIMISLVFGSSVNEDSEEPTSEENGRLTGGLR